MLLVDLHSEICLNEENLREGSELPHAEGGWWVHVYCTVRVLRRDREGVQGQGGSQAPTPPLTCWTLRIGFLKRFNVGQIYSLCVKIVDKHNAR